MVAASGLGLAGAVHALPAATSWPGLRLRLLPALAGLGDPDHLALTFDDGPDPASTPQFLEALDRLGWRATFFLLGEMVERAPGLAAEVAAAGHEVAVHSYHHRSQLRTGPRAVGEDIRRGVATVAEATGTQPEWFRPPYGILSASGAAAARAAGLRTVLWTAWGRDWRPQATPDTVIADLRTDLGPGGTLLLHDSDCTSAPQSWRSALGALPRLAELAEAGKYRIGPLADHNVVA
jgi:peptidoglycan-N-acetylglucosamine deacetylase